MHSATTPSLERLLQSQPTLWRGTQRQSTRRALPTGFDQLDARLPARGWEAGGLIELLPRQHGIGELSVLLPLLTQLTRAREPVALLNPPHVPYPPALGNAGVLLDELLVLHPDNDADTLWCAEQILRSGAFGAVIIWVLECKTTPLRRLQLAAEHGDALGFLYRPAHTADLASPAMLRLRLAYAQGGLSIDILKSRGGATGELHLCAADFDQVQGRHWPIRSAHSHSEAAPA